MYIGQYKNSIGKHNWWKHIAP